MTPERRSERPFPCHVEAEWGYRYDRCVSRVEDPIMYLTRDEVRHALPSVLDQVDLVEATYRAMARGRVEIPPKPGIHPRPNAFIHAMPAYLHDSDVAALKWVSGYPDNPSKGVPYISGLIVVNDAGTGLPTAIMDAAEITAARTAAASGVCIRAFAPQRWTDAAILGFGEQGHFHARVIKALNPDARIHVFDPRLSSAATEPDIEVHDDPRSAVRDSQLVVTAGPIVTDPHPVLARDWLSGDRLVLPIDFDFYVRADLVGSADLFIVDDIEQFDYYRKDHFAGWPSPRATVGQALEEGVGPGSVTVACNLGVGTLDAAFSAAVLDEARTSGLGRSLPR